MPLPSFDAFDQPEPRPRRISRQRPPKPTHDPVGHTMLSPHHHDFGRGNPESPSFGRWLFVHNGWIPAICLSLIVGFVVYVASRSMDGFQDIIAIPTFLCMPFGIWWVVYFIVRVCRGTLPRGFSMLYVTAVPAVYGLIALLYWIFN